MENTEYFAKQQNVIQVIMHLSIKQILILLLSYTVFVEFGIHESRTHEMD